MPQSNDLSRSLAALNQDSTIVVVIEISQSSWLVRGMIPGLARQPLKKLAPDEAGLLKLLHRWRSEAIRTGREIARIVVAYEAGRDGFWLARWLRARDIEAFIIHPSSVAVSREHRRAKTDRLDTELLMRAFLGCRRPQTACRDGWDGAGDRFSGPAPDRALCLARDRHASSLGSLLQS
jgi:transposase